MTEPALEYGWYREPDGTLVQQGYLDGGLIVDVVPEGAEQIDEVEFRTAEALALAEDEEAL